MKTYTPKYDAPANQSDSLALSQLMDLDLPDWSAMQPVLYCPPVEVAFAECEQWLQIFPHRERIRQQRAQAMCPVEFVL
jgi:hypothetical protein